MLPLLLGNIALGRGRNLTRSPYTILVQRWGVGVLSSGFVTIFVRNSMSELRVGNMRESVAGWLLYVKVRSSVKEIRSCRTLGAENLAQCTC
jgi:hypothetical protein